ncbi:MAG: hypothetical protein WCT23_10020, partial [Candidatus Neomarinimicrobiota bacterium]
IANSTPEYKANLEKFGKEYDINIPELSTTLSIHLSSQGYSNLYNSVVSVAYFNTPEFWKLQSNSKERLITEGKAKNLTEEEALKQDPFFKSIKDLSKSSTASIDEKKAALDYLARESFQFQSKVEQGTKGLVTSEPLQAIKASYEEANKKEKGFFVTVSTDSLKKAQDKIHTVKEATKVSGEVLTDVLQIKYGMDEETAKLVGARIIDGTYRGRPNYLNIRTILLP